MQNGFRARFVRTDGTLFAMAFICPPCRREFREALVRVAADSVGLRVASIEDDQIEPEIRDVQYLQQSLRAQATQVSRPTTYGERGQPVALKVVISRPRN